MIVSLKPQTKGFEKVTHLLSKSPGNLVLLIQIQWKCPLIEKGASSTLALLLDMLKYEVKISITFAHATLALMLLRQVFNDCRLKGLWRWKSFSQCYQGVHQLSYLQSSFTNWKYSTKVSQYIKHSDMTYHFPEANCSP